MATKRSSFTPASECNISRLRKAMVSVWNESAQNATLRGVPARDVSHDSKRRDRSIMNNVRVFGAMRQSDAL
jgi:hypothetical protein